MLPILVQFTVAPFSKDRVLALTGCCHEAVSPRWGTSHLVKYSVVQLAANTPRTCETDTVALKLMVLPLAQVHDETSP